MQNTDTCGYGPINLENGITFTFPPIVIQYPQKKIKSGSVVCWRFTKNHLPNIGETKSWKDQQNAKVKNPAKPDGECLERVDAVLQNWKKRL